MAGRIAVIGSGSWGTAAAGLLAAHADDVRVWAHSPKVAEAINRTHRNPRHLTDFDLPANVSASHDFAEVLDGAESMVMVVPSSFLRGICEELKGLVPENLPIVVLTKGIEPGTHLLMADVVADVLGNPGRVAALSGPNHAEEICQGLISAAVVACQSEALAAYFQETFVSQEFRVYRSQDIKGVEVCAAVKNVVAIACGICAGLGLGDNTLAVLMTRGLAEISRIVCAVGGDPMTCMGLAGMGDLVATCTSRHSRNRTFGEAFSHGESLEAYEERTGMVVEGARAALSTWELARELKIEAPLTNAVHSILYDGTGLGEAAQLLLDRDPHVEFYGLDTRE